MNLHAVGTMAYAQPALGLKSARTQEYEILARVTKNLRSASENLPFSFPELAVALDENRKLWTIFAMDLASPENSLPIDLKGQILSLAQFTISHTMRVLAGEDDPAPLIEINLSIMKGLSGKQVSK